ncbi:MAG TPA: bifunctional nuclease family protein [Polyangia bacterium]|nr:bifunctional nuclease family protein [Polyangia bacterium]
MIPVEAPRPRALVVATVAVLAAGGLALFLSAPRRATHAPAGYRAMEVTAVTPTGSAGYAVQLADAGRSRSITVYVGASEGLAISLRVEGRRYPRPLSMDLLDSVLRELGGELERVQIDELRDNTFHGSLIVRQGSRTIDVDARPSDALALALGRRAPILVAEPVIAAAGHDVDR